jgi:hypothetical protein
MIILAADNPVVWNIMDLQRMIDPLRRINNCNLHNYDRGPLEKTGRTKLEDQI